jgi:hypothetical protein
MLTPGLITPAEVELDPPRRGFRGDMPVPIDPLGPLPLPVPLALPLFFFSVAVLGI